MISPSQTPAGQKRRMITLAWKQRPSARSPSSLAIIVSEIIRIAANSEDDTAVHSDYGGQTVSLNYIKTKVAMQMPSLCTKRSLAIRERTFGPNHPDVANSQNNLTTLYSDWFDEYRLYHRKDGRVH